MNVIDTPQPRIRFFFWFLLAVFSTFFAEVTVGSAPLVFFKPDGWLLTVPVYGLHILVLAPLVIRAGRMPSWQTLYLAGTIFGLYEAYMTKILWSPTWNPSSYQIGGVAVMETLMLVFFWHPVMAFLVPLVFCERFLNLEPAILPGLGGGWTKRLSQYRFYIIAGMLAGLVLGSFLADPALALQVCLLNGSLIAILIVTWNATTRGNRFGFNNLLPGEVSWRVFILLLLVDFVALGVLIRPEAIPNWKSQLTILGMYGGLGFLVLKSRSRQPVMDPSDSPSRSEVSSPSPIRLWGVLILAFTLSCIAAASLLGPVKNYCMLAFYIICIPCGMLLFYRSIRGAFSK
jgi:hypothetical protein